MTKQNAKCFEMAGEVTCDYRCLRNHFIITLGVCVGILAQLFGTVFCFHEFPFSGCLAIIPIRFRSDPSGKSTVPKKIGQGIDI